MTINDRAYGKVDITSGSIIELINSKPIQRLKGIAQFGVPDEFYHHKNYSRYEHSVGVMVLLKRLGASEEEQIAGLLHDVSHTAFSHVIDWVVSDGKTEDYQDEQHERYIVNSDLPGILERHGHGIGRIADYHNFGLLEQSLPDLCADRADYSLREFPDEVIRICVPALTTVDSRIVFANESAALLFAQQFLKLQMGHWGGFEATSRYRLFADVLRQALKDGTITEDDFWQNDDFVVKKLVSSTNNKVRRQLQVLRGQSLSHLGKGGTAVYKKFRYVDPVFIGNGKLLRLSEATSKFAQELEEARQINKLGIRVPSVA